MAEKKSQEPRKLTAKEEKLRDLRRKYRAERENLTLFKAPITTLQHFALELLQHLRSLIEWCYGKKHIILLVAAAVTLFTLFVELEEDQIEFARWVQRHVYEAFYWIVLGVLSSVGLGTGLHTFVLYLGPFIAHVTQAAYICDSTNFQEPFYSPDRSTWQSIKCLPGAVDANTLTIFQVVSFVRWPALCWGFGTALGELPPYFMARAARLSGESVDNEDLEEFHATINADEEGADISSRLKKWVHKMVQKTGFWGILACASIPNPLFDLAGITCGHFLIPFTTFFGATAIGKAIIKMHIQMIFVVMLMSESVMEIVVKKIKFLPAFGTQLHDFILKKQQQTREQFMDGKEEGEEAFNYFGAALALLVFSMLTYFALSIVNHLAQSNRKRFDDIAIASELKKQ